MGMRTTIPNSNSFLLRDMTHKNAKAAIHRAVVTGVNVEKGTMSVRLEDVPYIASDVGFPLLGLSLPPEVSTDEDASVDYGLVSWGRYIPQIRDVIYVAFGMNGNLHALGYASIFYSGFTKKDDELGDAEKLGWGEGSGNKVEPGDWDFRSSRGSTLYLGSRAKIGSRHCSATFDFFTGDVITEAPLVMNIAGSSEHRFGSVRRKVLPTDAQEAAMPSTRGGTTAQEWSSVVRWESLPSGLDLAGFSFGDVIEEIGGVYAIKVSPKMLTTRRYFYSVSEAGAGKTYEESVDSNGNYYVDALTAVETKWNTPLSAWSVLSLSNDITTSQGFSVTAGSTISFTSASSFSLTSGSSTSLTSASGFTVTAPSVILGSAAAMPLVMSPSFISGFTIYLTAMTTLFTALAAACAVPPLTPLGASFTSIATACGTLQGSLAGMATVITKAS